MPGQALPGAALCVGGASGTSRALQHAHTRATRGVARGAGCAATRRHSCRRCSRGTRQALCSRRGRTAHAVGGARSASARRRRRAVVAGIGQTHLHTRHCGGGEACRACYAASCVDGAAGGTRAGVCADDGSVATRATGRAEAQSRRAHGTRSARGTSCHRAHTATALQSVASPAGSAHPSSGSASGAARRRRRRTAVAAVAAAACAVGVGGAR